MWTRSGAWWLSGSFFALLSLTSPPAGATPQLRLIYIRDAGTESCPEEMALRMSVASRLGYDPFSSTASGAIVARLSKADESLSGSVEIVDEQGISRGRRELDSRDDRCDELARALALSISIAVDPEYSEREETEEPKAPAPAPTTSARPRLVIEDAGPTEDATSASRERSAPAVSLAAMGTTMLGVGPAVAVGGAASGQVRMRVWSLGAGVRVVTSPAAEVEGDARLGTTLAAGELAACGHDGVVSLCVLGLAGALWARSEQIAVPRTDSGLFVAPGGRLGVALPLVGALAMVGQAEVLFPIWGPSAKVDDVEVWRVAPFAGGASAGVQVDFP